MSGSNQQSPTNSETLAGIRKDIEAIHHDLHEVRNSIRWLPELLDILEIDGRTLADILKEVREQAGSGEAPTSRPAHIVVNRPVRVRYASAKKVFGDTSSGRKPGTRRTSSGRSRGSGGGRSHRKR